MALVMMRTWLSRGNFPQGDQAFTYFSTISTARFTDIEFSAMLANTRITLSEHWAEALPSPRAESIFHLFLAHIHSPIHDAVPRLEGTLEIALQTGNQIWILLNFGLVATLKFFTAEHLSELEAFCTYGCEEVPRWERDIRGGPMIVGVRQLTRALQGKVGAAKISFDEEPLLTPV